MLHEALGGDDKAVIIGHDFGAGSATIAAVKEPDRWHKVVTMSVPPAGRVGAAFFTYPQIRKSSYMFFFQHPLSEMVVPHDDWAFVRGLWRDWSPGFEADGDIANFISSATPDGHFAAMLGYYRATLQPDLQSPDLADWQEAGNAVPTQPMLYLHGRTDGCMGVELTDGLEAELSPGSRVVVFDDIGHFMQLEDPALVNQTIIDFLAV